MNNQANNIMGSPQSPCFELYMPLIKKSTQITEDPRSSPPTKTSASATSRYYKVLLASKKKKSTKTLLSSAITTQLSC